MKYGKISTIGELREMITDLPDDYPIGVLIHLGRDSKTGKLLVIEDDEVFFAPEIPVKGKIGARLMGVSEQGKE